MKQTISAEELIQLVQKSDLDATIKGILIRDIRNEGVNEFLIDQVIAYCDNAIGIINQRLKNPA